MFVFFDFSKSEAVLLFSLRSARAEVDFLTGGGGFIIIFVEKREGPIICAPPGTCGRIYGAY